MSITFLPFFVILLIQLSVAKGSPPLCDPPSSTSTGNQSNSGWWCATTDPIGQTISSAVATDSCFCVWFANMTSQDAWMGCSGFGGYLTDIRNSQENDLIYNLITQAAAQTVSTIQYPLWTGLQKLFSVNKWNTGCNMYAPIYTNYNSTAESQASGNAMYMYSSDKTWTPNIDPQNGTSLGFVCRIDRNPCGGIHCNATQTCLATDNCAMCLEPSTTTPYQTTTPPPAGISNPVPLCDSSALDGGWWCAKDYALGQNVSSALATDSCFCYINKNMSQLQAEVECASNGGYLTDIRNSAENDLLQQLVFIVMQKAAVVQITSCLSGWTLWNGACYRVFKEKIHFGPAEQMCQTYSAHLVSIHSLAEFNMVSKLATSTLAMWDRSYPGYWTGVSDELGPTGAYINRDGTPYDYVMPQSWCAPFNWMMSAFPIVDLHYIGVRAELPCAHVHYDDLLNPACKKVPDLYPFWIGYEKNTANDWDRGCEVVAAQNYNTAVNGSMTLAAYVYNYNKTWTQQDATLTNVARGAMCRKDLNPCGFNNCSNYQVCVNNGSCFICMNTTTTTTTLSTTITTTTAIATSTQATQTTSIYPNTASLSNSDS